MLPRPADGVDELRAAADALGLITELQPAGSGIDVVVLNPQGGRVSIQIKRFGLASVHGLERRVERWTADRSAAESVPVLIADRVTREARQVLDAAGWGWLDLRGHLHVVAPGFFVDADVPAAGKPLTRSPPLAGRVGIEIAAHLLLEPGRRLAVRQLARTLNRAPSSVSQALKAMQAAGLVDEQQLPVVPDLFWQLAEHWHTPGVDVQLPPRTVDGAALRIGLDGDVEATTGWALSDTTAAARYGAPVGARADHPPDFYVPDHATLRRATKVYGIAGDPEHRGARLKVAPVALVCSSRISLETERWPMARPLYVALDLAQDSGRGREILDTWTPDTGGPRVW